MATPVKIESRIKDKGLSVRVEGGKIVDISLVPTAKAGDWLLCHGEMAINKISDSEAQNILALVKKCSHNHSHASVK